MIRLTVLIALTTVTLASGCGIHADTDPLAQVAEPVVLSSRATPFDDETDVSLARDARAESAFHEVDNALKGLSSLPTLATYQLEDVSDAVARIEARVSATMAAKPVPPEWQTKAFATGDDDARIDIVSAGERFVRRSEFHRSSGSLGTSMLSDTFYVGKARSHVTTVGLLSAASLGVLYNYKVRHYKNAEVFPGSGLAPTVTVYQVAVAFNTSINGVPIIGPGGKVAVHLTLDGRVIAHEATVRNVKASIRTHDHTTMVTPSLAEATAISRLTLRGVDLSRYKIVRREFGYFRRGRHSPQVTLAPHYAFFLEPATKGTVGQFDKRFVEVIPAVSDAKSLALIAADDATEKARKAKMAAVPDIRK